MQKSKLVELLDEARSLIDTETPHTITETSIDRVDAILASIASRKPDWKTEIDSARQRIGQMKGGLNKRIEHCQSAYDAIHGLRMRAENCG